MKCTLLIFLLLSAAFELPNEMFEFEDKLFASILNMKGLKLSVDIAYYRPVKLDNISDFTSVDFIKTVQSIHNTEKYRSCKSFVLV